MVAWSAEVGAVRGGQVKGCAACSQGRGCSAMRGAASGGRGRPSHTHPRRRRRRAARGGACPTPRAARGAPCAPPGPGGVQAGRGAAGWVGSGACRRTCWRPAGASIRKAPRGDPYAHTHRTSSSSCRHCCSSALRCCSQLMDSAATCRYCPPGGGRQAAGGRRTEGGGRASCRRSRPPSPTSLATVSATRRCRTPQLAEQLVHSPRRRWRWALRGTSCRLAAAPPPPGARCPPPAPGYALPTGPSPGSAGSSPLPPGWSAPWPRCLPRLLLLGWRPAGSLRRSSGGGGRGAAAGSGRTSAQPTRHRMLACMHPDSLRALFGWRVGATAVGARGLIDQCDTVLGRFSGLPSSVVIAPKCAASWSRVL